MTYNLGNVKGPAGIGIQSITKTSTSGLVDTYTITYTNGTTSTFTVTNGSSGADIVTSWESTLSDEKVASEKLTKNSLDAKSPTTHGHGNIDKDGKIGSTSGKVIVTGTGGVLEASSTTIPTKTSDLTNDGDGTNVFVKNNDSRLSDSRTPKTHTHGNISNGGAIGSTSGKIITTGTDGILQASNYPSIPSKTSDLTNDSGFITSGDIPSKTSDLTNDGSDGTDTYVETSDLPDISGKIDTAGTGLSKSGTTLNHSNSVYPEPYPVFKKITFDTQGHITGTDDVEGMDLPSHNQGASSIICVIEDSGGHTLQIPLDDWIEDTLSDIEDLESSKLSATKVTSWSGTVSDSNVPSEKLVKDTIDTLVGDISTIINGTGS